MMSFLMFCICFNLFSGDIKNTKAIKAKEKYESALKKIQEQYAKDLGFALKQAMRDGDLESAQAIQDMIDSLGIVDEDQIEKDFVGTWSHREGSMVIYDGGKCSSGNKKGTWKIDSNEKTIVIEWSDVVDTFVLPVDAKGMKMFNNRNQEYVMTKVK